MVISLKFISSCLALIGRALGKGKVLFFMSPTQRKKIRNIRLESHSQLSEKNLKNLGSRPVYR